MKFIVGTLKKKTPSGHLAWVKFLVGQGGLCEDSLDKLQNGREPGEFLAKSPQGQEGFFLFPINEEQPGAAIEKRDKGGGEIQVAV